MFALGLNLLETLPSWPVTQEPTVVDFLFLTLLIPLAITAVFTALVMSPSWYRKSQE